MTGNSGDCLAGEQKVKERRSGLGKIEFMRTHRGHVFSVLLNVIDWNSVVLLLIGWVPGVRPWCGISLKNFQSLSRGEGIKKIGGEAVLEAAS